MGWEQLALGAATGAAGAGAGGAGGGDWLSALTGGIGSGLGGALGGGNAAPAGPAISGLGGGINVTVAPPQFAPQPQPTLPGQGYMPGAIPLYPVGYGTTPGQPWTQFQFAPGQSAQQFAASQQFGDLLPLLGIGLLVTAVVRSKKKGR